MTYQTLENLNASKGFHTIFVYANDVTNGLFSNLLLFVLFIIIAMASYYSSVRLKGKGDFPVSLTVAGFVTTGAALLMLLVDGLLHPFSAVVCMIITFASALWLFTSNRN